MRKIAIINRARRIWRFSVKKKVRAGSTEDVILFYFTLGENRIVI